LTPPRGTGIHFHLADVLCFGPPERRADHFRGPPKGDARASGQRSNCQLRGPARPDAFLTSRTREGIFMNKGELIEAVAAAADISKTDATKAVDAVVDSITRALKKGDQVSIVGFGTFTVKDRAARSGRNPKTGETIHIPASKAPGFKAGKALKDAVN